jgi:hypothetical protein
LFLQVTIHYNSRQYHIASLIFLLNILIEE